MPNFIIIGAQKAGTTSAGHHLSQHPRLHVLPKEVHYFDRNDKSLEWYNGLFAANGLSTTPKVLIGERTPEYMYQPQAMHRMVAAVDKDCKFIVFLRNPIDRAFSAWNMHQSVHQANHPGNCPRGVPFEECVKAELERLQRGDIRYANDDFLHRGFYDEQLQLLVKELGEFDSRVIVCIAERVLRQPNVEYNRVFYQLGVEPHPIKFQSGIHKRRYATDPISPQLRDTLRKLFAPHVAALRKLINDDIPEWYVDWPTRASGGP